MEHRQILSQEEINALLRGENEVPSQLSPMQKDALGEIGNITYGSASTALSELLNKRVIIDTPTVFVSTQREIREQHPVPYLIIEVDYREGLKGANVLIMKVQDAVIISDLMMGGNGQNPKEILDQIELSAVGEAMNQMVGSASTALSSMIGKRIQIEPPRIKLVDLASEEEFVKGCKYDDKIVAVSFKLEIQDLTKSEMMLLIPYEFGIEMADLLITKALPQKKTETVTTHETVPSPPPFQTPGTETVVPVDVPSSGGVPSSIGVPSPRGIPSPMGGNINQIQPGGVNSPPLAAVTTNNFRQGVQPQVMVQPAQFAPIGMSKSNKESGNIGLILDVPLQVTVELGNTRMRIKEILELGIGSVIELDKVAGDPVDIYVNGKLIAKGEVVVIDENFGIKVTDIISPIERANTLQ